MSARGIEPRVPESGHWPAGLWRRQLPSQRSHGMEGELLEKTLSSNSP